MIKSLILFDGFVTHYANRPFNLALQYFANALTKLKKYEYRKPKVYSSIDEMVEKYLSSNITKGMSKNSAKLLVNRSFVYNEGGYRFNHDYKVTMDIMYVVSNEVQYSFARRLNCPILIIARENFLLFGHHMEEVFKFLKNHEEYLIKEDVCHHFHMDNPELFIDKLLDFLSKLNNVHKL